MPPPKAAAVPDPVPANRSVIHDALIFALKEIASNNPDLTKKVEAHIAAVELEIAPEGSATK